MFEGHGECWQGVCGTVNTQHERSDVTNFRMSRHTDLEMRMGLGGG